MKKTYLAWIYTRTNDYHFIIPHYFLINKLSENFEKIYLINLEELKLYKDYGSFPHQSKISVKDKEKYPLKKNVEFINPSNKYEFNNFMKDKNIIAISNITRRFPNLPIHFILSKHKIKLIQCSYVGNVQFNLFDFKINYRSFEFFFYKHLSYKIVTLLKNLGLVPKIDIKFTSFKYHFKKNFFKKILEFFNFYYIKEYILINSRSYDLALIEKNKSSEEQITYLDPNLNDEFNRALTGKLPKENFDRHYNSLINFLKKFQKIFKKKIMICIHPRDNLEEKKKIFHDFEVVQFKTRENVIKSSIVLFFDTSAIIDAIILKKKVLTLYSDHLDKNLQKGSTQYKNKLGILQLNIKDVNKLVEKENLIKAMNYNIKNYENYINQNIKPDTDELGYSKIVRIIKERYFN